MISAGRQTGNTAKVTFNVVENNGTELTGISMLQAPESGSAVNVGIGTTSPSEKLEVAGGAAAILIDSTTNEASLKYDNSTTTANIKLANNDLKVELGGGEKLRILANGNVGIGATSPLASLQVGLSTSNAGSTLAMFGANLQGVLSALSLVNTGGNSAIGYGTALDFHLNSGYSPTGRIATLRETDAVVKAGMAFFTYEGGLIEKMRIANNGTITFNSYNSTNKTGTPTYLLGTDASGNVVKTLTTPSPVTSQAASLYDLIPNGAFTTTYAFTSTAGTYAEVMSGDDVITETGTYSVQMIVNDFAVGGTQYDEKYSGVMSWHDTSTNDSGIGASSEIVLHRAGHAGNSGITYLRTRETAAAGNNELKLEIMCNRTYTGASNVIFKFVRLI